MSKVCRLRYAFGLNLAGARADSKTDNAASAAQLAAARGIHEYAEFWVRRALLDALNTALTE